MTKGDLEKECFILAYDDGRPIQNGRGGVAAGGQQEAEIRHHETQAERPLEAGEAVNSHSLSPEMCFFWQEHNSKVP